MLLHKLFLLINNHCILKIRLFKLWYLLRISQDLLGSVLVYRWTVTRGVPIHLSLLIHIQLFTNDINLWTWIRLVFNKRLHTLQLLLPPISLLQRWLHLSFLPHHLCERVRDLLGCLLVPHDSCWVFFRRERYLFGWVIYYVVNADLLFTVVAV